MSKKRRVRKKQTNKGLKLLLFIILTILIIVFSRELEDNNETSSSTDNTKIETLNGAKLKTAIHKMIKQHKSLDFEVSARYWWDNYFKKTDWNPKGYYWDMYSDKKHKTYQGGNIQNREHCMPRSWWSTSDAHATFDANGDLHNIFPSDAKANSEKKNLSLGEVGSTSFDNGVVKTGINTYPEGYRGKVFEPADEYKGDFARVYFYMVTCYEDYSKNWRTDATKSMLRNETYPVFRIWAIQMLLDWHRNDTISEKEKLRNNAVYKIQGNRNPFVDEPQLAEYIWGDKSDQVFDLNSLRKNNSTYYRIKIQ